MHIQPSQWGSQWELAQPWARRWDDTPGSEGAPFWLCGPKNNLEQHRSPYWTVLRAHMRETLMLWLGTTSRASTSGVGLGGIGFFVVCFSYLSVFNTSDSEAHVYPTENWLFGLSPSVVGAKAVRLDMDYTGKRGKRWPWSFEAIWNSQTRG